MLLVELYMCARTVCVCVCVCVRVVCADVGMFVYTSALSVERKKERKIIII